MNQELKSASHTYAQYSNQTFGHLPPDNKGTNEHKLLIRDFKNAMFAPFMDDHVGSVITFDAIFEFLHTKYFLKCAFGLIYLALKKTHVFTDQLNFIGFTNSTKRLWPLIKH